MNSRRSAHVLTDLELLERQAEMSMDGRRRLAGTCGVTIAAARDGQRLFIGSDVPDTLVPTLIGAINTSRRAPAPASSRPRSEPAARSWSPSAGRCPWKQVPPT